MDENATWNCSICGLPSHGYGNNPQPVRPSYDDRCCDTCNTIHVIPARIDILRKRDQG